MAKKSKLPSYVKFKKDGIEYLSAANRCNYFIKELTRAAFRDVAKYILRKTKAKIPKIEGNARKAVQYWIPKDNAQLYVGYKWYDKAKKRIIRGFYAAFFERGEAGLPRLDALYNSTFDNIDEIRKIEGQYLSAIEDENRALGLIDEEEDISDDE